MASNDRLSRILRTQLHWVVAAIAILLVAFYWGMWAEDRYVSRATVVLESPQLAQPELSMDKGYSCLTWMAYLPVR